MAKKPDKVVLDSNILVSALVYGGKPEEVVRQAVDQNIQAVISPVLQLELLEVLAKKFRFSPEKLQAIEEEIKENFEVVYPNTTINAVKDEDDNRVLEAALEGDCGLIVTGDKELLKLGRFKGIKIITPDEFLKWWETKK